MKKVHVKTGDEVMIMSGKDKGKTGKVLQVSPAEGKVIVEKRNMVTKHVKSRKVQPVCPKCKKPTRVGHQFDKDGKKIRICRKCGATL